MRLHLFSLLLACLLAAACHAAEDDEVVVGPVAPEQPNQMQRFGFPNFDQMLFQNDGNATLGEQRIRARVELQLADLDRVCQLSDAQKQKLQLAVRGDMQRFLSEAALLRRNFDALMKEQGNDPNAFNQVWQQVAQDMQPLRQRLMQGLTTAPTSLLMKMLPNTLTPQQQRDYEAVTSERQRFRYEAAIAASLHQLEEIVSITETQREALTKLLLAMPAPRRFSHYDPFVVLCRLAIMPRNKLEPLFAPEQWKTISVHLDQYRSHREAWLEAGLVEPGDFPEPAAEEAQ